ncbi:iron uptake porin [Nostoc sp. FACHB-110]|uniref:iron uptake porin n=1 Tax=Nostoc sp. FACHB-110 TaxID=2692834 RepID=UPI001687EC92|nr:iron uptake porin [Nostoc sp. FACHB-110]MBD2435912.1 carbohydrate porin [Nostoc sp. FACHB-110]
MNQEVVETIPEDEMTQTLASTDTITSVNQLADVEPTDWAFQALQSLIERYGVITGYPNGNYRGYAAMTRYEFAAGINAVLERVQELIASGVEAPVSREDLLTLDKLQTEFANELANLQGRVDNLAANTAKLEANQFSTTTKLTGLVVAAVTAGGFSGSSIIDPTGKEIAHQNPNATVIFRASLNLTSSFSGTDRLLVRLESGSPGGEDNAAGLLEPSFGSAVDFSLRSAIDERLQIARLQYTFTPFKDFTATLGPVLSPTDYFDRNSYANLSFLDFLTLALSNNYLLFPFEDLGAGAVIEWNPNSGPFTIRAEYIAPGAANPNNSSFAGGSPLIRLLYPTGNSDNGLFANPYQTTVEVNYSPSTTFAVRLQYSNGSVFGNQFDVFGANFELALSKQLAIFGRYGYGSYDNTIFGDIHPNYWMAGLSFRDVFVPGTLAGIAASQPFVESKVGNTTQMNFEAFYNLPLSDNIRISPVIQVITNPGNQDSNGTIITGTLRTSLFF